MPHTFSLDSARAFREKMKRELRRMDMHCFDEEEVVDHAINFCITAWHMCDWVWTERKRDYRLKFDLAKLIEVDPSKFSVEEFRLAMLRKCEALKYCCQIATAAKHVGVEVYEDDRPISTTASGRNVYSTSGEMRVVPVLKIIDMETNTRVDALPIFDAALAHWMSFE